MLPLLFSLFRLSRVVQYFIFQMIWSFTTLATKQYTYSTEGTFPVSHKVKRNYWSQSRFERKKVKLPNSKVFTANNMARFSYDVVENKNSRVSAKPVGQIHSMKTNKSPSIKIERVQMKSCSTKDMMKVSKPPIIKCGRNQVIISSEVKTLRVTMKQPCFEVKRCSMKKIFRGTSGIE